MSSGFPETGIDLLNAALVSFTGCVGSAVPDICSYGLTVGETYVPFDPDPEDECEDDETICSQVWVRVMNAVPTAVGTSFGGGDCASVMRLELEVGILRCFEIIEDGEAPTATQVMAGAMQSMEDMNRIYCAAMACEVWEEINAGEWTPAGPMGGQYGGIWTFTVEV